MKIGSYSTPDTLEGALAEVARHGAGSRVVAGGTDLVLQLRSRDADAEGALVNIKGIRELRGVRDREGFLEIGTLTSVTDLLRDPLIAERAPVLRDAADKFASVQIRNAATVGGNLVNASPAADLAVPLLVLDARVSLARLEGGQLSTREVPLTDFFQGPGSTGMLPDELLTGVRLPPTPPNFKARFYKAGTRPALDIAVVSTGVGFAVTDGRIVQARVALGAVAPTPIRSATAEEALEGQAPGEAVARAAAAGAAADAKPIDDVRASAWYRRHLVTVLIEREVMHVLED